MNSGGERMANGSSGSPDINPKLVADIKAELAQQPDDLGVPQPAASGGRNIFGKVRGIFGKAGEKIGKAAGGIGGGVGGAGERLHKGSERWKELLEPASEKLGNKLQNLKIFGGPAINFLGEMGAGAVASIAAKTVAKELLIQIGLGAATGFGGRIVVGAVAGAIVGAGKEYVKQVRGNFKKYSESQVAQNEADEQMVELKKKRFLERFKPTDYHAIGKSALRGAVFGAVGGVLASAVLELWEASGGDVGQLVEGAKHLAGNIPGVQGVGNLAGGAMETAGKAGETIYETRSNLGEAIGDTYVAKGAGTIAGGIKDVGGNVLGGAGEAAKNIPGVQGAGDIGGNIGKTVGDTAGNIRQAVGLGDSQPQVPEANQQFDVKLEAAQPTEVTAQEPGVEPKAPVPGEVTAQEPGVEPKAPGISAGETPPTLQEAARQGQGLTVGEHYFTPEEVSALTANQAEAHAIEAINSLGDSIPLEAGSNPWQVSEDILKNALGHQPSPGQIMELDKIICQQNGIAVPTWGIPGSIDHGALPIGFPIKIDDEVKNAILAIAEK